MGPVSLSLRAFTSAHLKDSVLHQKSTFSILHYHLYKTPTSVHLFSHLFYLNNQFSQLFYYFLQLTHFTNFNTRALSLSTIFSDFLLSLFYLSIPTLSLSVYLSPYPFLYLSSLSSHGRSIS